MADIIDLVTDILQLMFVFTSEL